MSARAKYGVLLAVLAGALIFWSLRDRQQAGKVDAPAVRPTASPLAARASAIYAETGGPAIVTVRLFNHRARQAAATNAALDAAASKAPREAVSPIELRLPASGWLPSVSFQAEPGGASLPAAAVRVVTRPDADVHTLGAGESVHARFEISAEGVAGLGSRFVAIVSAGEWRAVSNSVMLEAPLDPRERLIQRGRAAEARADFPALAAAGDALVAADASDPWGYWYRGLALEGQRDRAGALAAYEAAAARLPDAKDTQEPPVDLFSRILKLR